MRYVLITANRNYSSWSLRPWLLMKALGLNFEDRLEPFLKPNNYEDFRAFSPTGQVPVLQHEGRRFTTVWALRSIWRIATPLSGQRTPMRGHGRNVQWQKCIQAFPRSAMIAR